MVSKKQREAGIETMSEIETCHDKDREADEMTSNYKEERMKATEIETARGAGTDRDRGRDSLKQRTRYS